MEIDIGRKNIAFGWMWLTLGMLFGFFLQLKMRDANWAGSPFEAANWYNHAAIAAYSYPRPLWRLAHAHWGLLALANIFYGMLIDRLAVSSMAKKAGSALCIIGTIVFSGGLFAAGFSPGLEKVAMVGFACVGCAAVIQVAGWLTTLRHEEPPPGDSPDTSA
jgi:hypothetical protein